MKSSEERRIRITILHTFHIKEIDSPCQSLAYCRWCCLCLTFEDIILFVFEFWRGKNAFSYTNCVTLSNYDIISIEEGAVRKNAFIPRQNPKREEPRNLLMLYELSPRHDIYIYIYIGDKLAKTSSSFSCQECCSGLCCMGPNSTRMTYYFTWSL